MAKKLAFEIVLSSGNKVLLVEPKDMAVFFNSLPSLNAIARKFKEADEANQGLTGYPPITNAEIEGIYPLLAEMADITVEQFLDLGVFDKLAIMQGLAVFVPNALPTPQAVSQSQPTSQESEISQVSS